MHSAVGRLKIQDRKIRYRKDQKLDVYK